MGLKEKDLNKKITCVEYKPEFFGMNHTTLL